MPARQDPGLLRFGSVNLHWFCETAGGNGGRKLEIAAGDDEINLAKECQVIEFLLAAEPV